MEDGVYARLLRALEGRPAEVAVVTACLESLEALEAESDLTAEERDEVEMGTLDASQRVRKALAEAVRRSRDAPPLDEYPAPGHLEALRWLAGEQWALLKPRPEEHRLAVVKVAREFQTWALAERLCEESVTQASRNLDRAASLARLAREVADRVRGPARWRKRVRGYAAAHEANVLRVAGRLNEAEAGLVAARRLWKSGSDPAGVLDPGRLLNLEGALRRDQRLFDKALALLDEAAAVGRSPELALIQKGFTLEVMGEYERAVETLLQAETLVERRGDPRLRYMLRFNLAVNDCHAGCYREAAERLQQVREVVTDRGDENEIIRVTWLEGRIAAGLGRRKEALALLEQARREFAVRGMWYDVALALLETAILLLEEKRTADVKVLARELTRVFASNGVHREALAALRLFQEAAEREEATAGLARSVLRFLFRARHDQGLRFTS